MSEGVEFTEGIVWQLACCLALVWMIVYMVLINGIGSLGKVGETKISKHCHLINLKFASDAVTIYDSLQHSYNNAQDIFNYIFMAIVVKGA